jgi:hypothetical protein
MPGGARIWLKVLKYLPPVSQFISAVCERTGAFKKGKKQHDYVDCHYKLQQRDFKIVALSEEDCL